MVNFAEGTRGCGVMLASGDLNTYYQLRLEPGRNRVVFDRWPRPGDEPFMHERPVNLRVGDPIRLCIRNEGSVIVAYTNDQVALTTRGYASTGGGWDYLSVKVRLSSPRPV